MQRACFRGESGTEHSANLGPAAMRVKRCMSDCVRESGCGADNCSPALWVSYWFRLSSYCSLHAIELAPGLHQVSQN